VIGGVGRTMAIARELPITLPVLSADGRLGLARSGAIALKRRDNRALWEVKTLLTARGNRGIREYA